MPHVIRAGVRHDFEALRGIELASFETLRAAQAVTGEAAASSDDELQIYLDSGFLFVAGEDSGGLFGYTGGYEAEGWLHIGEMDVHPLWQRQGIGRCLIGKMLATARERDLNGATLTTDRFAPFNAPFYQKLGFRPLDAAACSPRLKAILASEADKGLDPRWRVAMMLAF
ncbi:GNAT family N-acetyltransferase [Allorhizobium taibaishanense]|uniref:GNAT family N-acetyltransferase n=1 Tax=Allorhizobium taibaishanense TaxID=887144 RepID=A0A1Q9A4S4_9HYPH|nr:GNAT family N-acetyltransferase [Allorhizobium taibaishanense]MBB4006660.1 GNAT superfamily N-acetyltransferase [Allorhizobium taibaishanense]OLP49573.1 GNAT family N-acetyltransferase [Allorhizobium taibaishanense]